MSSILTGFGRAVHSLSRPAGRPTALTIVLTLAVAIGSLSTLFSVVESVVMDALPYPNAERLVRIQLSTPTRRAQTVEPLVATPWELYDAWKGARSFDRLGAIMVGSAIMSGTEGRNAERIPTVAVTASLFGVLSAQPALGRAFVPDEDSPGTSRVMILSHAFWTRRLHGDTAVIGQSVTLDAEPYRVVGVMPPGFRVPLSVASVDEEKTEVLIPIGAVRRNRRSGARPEMVGVIGRLTEGFSTRTATAEIDQLSAAHLDVLRRVQQLVLRTDGDENLPRVTQVLPLHDFIVRDARRMLLLLAGGVVAVLLMSCANAANLLLARTIERRREFAVRRALGSTPTGLVIPLLLESGLLALLAAALGTLIAAVALPTVVRLSGRLLPFVQKARLDWSALAVVILAVIGVTIVITLVPAIVVLRDSAFDALKDGTPGSGRRVRNRLSDALVVAQIGLAVVLLTMTILLTRSLGALTGTYRGYDARNLVAVQFPVSDFRYPTAETQAELTRRILADVAATPSVTAVAAATGAPAIGGSSTIVSRPGLMEASGGVRLRAQTWAVTPNYFDVLHIPVRAGRPLRFGDDSSAVVIDVSAANTLFGRDDPVGLTVTWDQGARVGRVIGVVGNVEEVYPDSRTVGKRRTSPMHFYTLLGVDATDDVSLIVQTPAHPETILGAMRRIIARIDPAIPIEQAGTLESIVSEPFARERLLAILVAFFSALGVAIAAVGTYAVVAYATARRTQEVGIRIALGARPTGIIGLVLRRVLVLVAIGSTLGLLGSAATTRSLRQWLFEVSPFDPGAFAFGGLLILAVALLAGGLPAWRATRVDPTTAFRRE